MKLIELTDDITMLHRLMRQMCEYAYSDVKPVIRWILNSICRFFISDLEMIKDIVINLAECIVSVTSFQEIFQFIIGDSFPRKHRISINSITIHELIVNIRIA